MTKQEAMLYLEILDVANSEGQGSEECYKLGKKLRDKYYPETYSWIFEEKKW